MADNFDFEEESDELSITPLGAGQEVGRSCILMKFKGKRIVLDCGIHPGLRTKDCLPFLDGIDDFTAIDLVLISHFHLDHSGGLPVLLQQVGPKTRCFMTPPTKAIYRWLLADYVRVSSSSGGGESVLFSDRDIVTSLENIETVDFHSELEVAGVKFTAFHAGHVLGAAMFMIEIAGVKVLYTGDFSRQEDRHLMCAEIPPTVPDVLITESTYGTHIHDKREDREARFTGLVYDIVTRGGRCLIPAFALGRAQELMLILDEFWDSHPELHSIPIYYASQLARKCMSVYQTYVHAMNERVRRRLINNNPFVFRHIANLKNMDQFDDTGPCVIMASPGMMQSGLSRELFENWCTDRRNGVIIAGYCVEGTLAKLILSHPTEVPTSNGQTLPLKCSVDYISFSAHTDYQQTSDFVRQLKPAHIVLVHGEKNEMLRLKGALTREYEDDESYNIDLYAPKNGESVLLHFRGEKMAKVLGEMAVAKPQDGLKLSGVLIKKNFSYHIIKPSDLPSYTDLATSTVTQRLTAKFTGPPSLLHFHLTMMCGNVQVLKQRGDRQQFLVMNAVEVTWEPRMVVLEWQSNPVNDMFADAVQTVLLNAELEGMPWQGIPQTATLNVTHFRDALMDLLRDMFGSMDVEKRGDDGMTLSTFVNEFPVEIDVNERTVSCPKDLKLEKVIRVAMMRLYHNLMPIKVETV